MDLRLEIGTALRRARVARRLTLRGAAALSNSAFKASSIAGYERGERAITVQRFCDLADLYGVDPARLLDGALREARREQPVEVDLTAADSGRGPADAVLLDFARRVMRLRQDATADRVTLRREDIEVLATFTGTSPAELRGTETHSRPTS